MRIDSLETFNDQIGGRMQERDQDLAAAYDKIDRLGGTIHRLIFVVIALGMPYIVRLCLWAVKKGLGTK